jgi:hypothetical protein
VHQSPCCLLSTRVHWRPIDTCGPCPLSSSLPYQLCFRYLWDNLAQLSHALQRRWCIHIKNGCPSCARVVAGSNPGIYRTIGGDSEAYELMRSGPPSSNGSSPAALDITKRHGAPGLLVLAGAQGLTRAWIALKRSLPKVRSTTWNCWSCSIVCRRLDEHVFCPLALRFWKC